MAKWLSAFCKVYLVTWFTLGKKKTLKSLTPGAIPQVLSTPSSKNEEIKFIA